MLAFERRQQILDHVQKDKRVIITDLATTFGVSEETIRRDLKKLEKDGVLIRFHGGASTTAPVNEELPYHTRHQRHVAEKRYMATKLATLIGDGQIIFADSSSSVLEGVSELIKQKRTGLSLITNSVPLLMELRERPIQVFSTGGELRGKSNSLVGPIAESTIGLYHGDVALFGCKGLSMAQGVTESNEAEKQVKCHMVHQVKKVILLADHTKFDQTAFVKLFEVDKVDCVITDQAPSDDWLAFFEERSIEIMY